MLSGRSLLSVGPPGGFGELCLWAEEGGAARVRCLEAFPPEGAGFEIFRLAHCLRRSKVEAYRASLYDVSPELLGGAFDIVHAAGVPNRYRHPLLALEALASVAGQLLVLDVQTLRGGHPQRAYCEYAPEGERMAGGGGSASGASAAEAEAVWACDMQALASMLKARGFARVLEANCDMLRFVILTH